jgi:integrase
MTTTKQLQTRTARQALAPRGKPYFVPTGTPGLAIGYRRLADQVGNWSLRQADGSGGNRIERIGTADDQENANGADVLSFSQAVEKARDQARGQVDGGRAITIGRALEDYAKDLTTRGRNPYNATRLLKLIPKAMAARPVGELNSAELKRWRDELGLEPANLNRTLRPFKAALNLAADNDDRITARPWKQGLKALPGAERARPIRPLSVDQVFALVDAAYAYSQPFGLFVEVAAQTGARASQIAAIQVGHLQADRLMVPSSHKGNDSKQAKLTAVQITEELAARLRQAAAGRDEHAALLVREDGQAWDPTMKSYRYPFDSIVRKLALGDDVSITWLRSSAIVRQILAGVPLQAIAASLDTSVLMIERHYAKFIADAKDSQLRRGLLRRPADNVVALRSA